VRNNPLVSLKKRADFNRVYNSGKSAANKFFVVYSAANNLPHNRLGLSVSKKVGCAVIRNRIRRLVKESIRLKTEISDGHDIIVIARAAKEPVQRQDSFIKVNGSLSQLFGKLGLTKP
jgi:ribonuclease P protein component